MPAAVRTKAEWHGSKKWRPKVKCVRNSNNDIEPGANQDRVEYSGPSGQVQKALNVDCGCLSAWIEGQALNHLERGADTKIRFCKMAILEHVVYSLFINRPQRNRAVSRRSKQAPV
jgi:hypothetical protein